MNPIHSDCEESNILRGMVRNLQNQISSLNKTLDLVNIPVAVIYKDNSRRELTIEERLSIYINSQKKF
jgi:hypothetical protein